MAYFDSAMKYTLSAALVRLDQSSYRLTKGPHSVSDVLDFDFFAIYVACALTEKWMSLKNAGFFCFFLHETWKIKEKIFFGLIYHR